MCNGGSCFTPVSLFCLSLFSRSYENSWLYPLSLLRHPPFPLHSTAFLLPFHLLSLEWQVTSILSASVYTFQFPPFFSATWGTNTQLLFETHFFSWLPPPTASSLVTTPQISHVPATPICSVAPTPPFHASMVLYTLFLLPAMPLCSLSSVRFNWHFKIHF